MRRRATTPRVFGLLAGVCSALVAAMLVALPAPSALAESNGGVKVMPLGDSITDGYNVPGGYRNTLWQKVGSAGYKVDFVGSMFNGPSSLGDHDHEGHSGWTISQIDAQIVGWLRTSNPHTVLLHIGTNDMYNASGAPARLGTLLDHITSNAPSAEVFVATIIPRPATSAAVSTFNAAVPGLVSTRAAAGKHVHLVNMFPALSSADLADGIHPTANGYAKMGQVWYSALQAVPGSMGNGTVPTTPVTTPPVTTPPVTTPPVTTPPVTTPPVTTPPVTTGCTATFRMVGNWNSGYQGEVTVRNGGSAAYTGWTTNLTVASGQSITNLWGGVITGSTGAVTVGNATYNGAVAAQGSTTFGFIADGNITPPTAVRCAGA